jgi:uncharacterized membrane protein (UPF0127 family)
MQSSLILAGLLVVVAFAIILYTKFGAKNTSFLPVKIGNKVVSAEIADTMTKQMRGLMGRKSLPQNQGMLFVFDEPAVRKFWMFNTSIPLDMIWMDSNKKIIYIEADVQPCPILNCTSYGPNKPAQYVLEVNANYTTKNNISVGDTIAFKVQ